MLTLVAFNAPPLDPQPLFWGTGLRQEVLKPRGIMCPLLSGHVFSQCDVGSGRKYALFQTMSEHLEVAARFLGEVRSIGKRYVRALVGWTNNKVPCQR